jgi:hypothetical protein
MLGWVIFGVGAILWLFATGSHIADIVFMSECDPNIKERGLQRSCIRGLFDLALFPGLMALGTILMVTGLLIELSSRPAVASVFGGRRRK